MRVNRNYFGRQVESFQESIPLPFLDRDAGRPFRCVFIRAPVVEKVLPHRPGIQEEESLRDATIVAPSKKPLDDAAARQCETVVEPLARLPARADAANGTPSEKDFAGDAIVAVRQGNAFGTSFHPELTDDDRIHEWWLRRALESIQRRRKMDCAEHV